MPQTELDTGQRIERACPGLEVWPRQYGGWLVRNPATYPESVWEVSAGVFGKLYARRVRSWLPWVWEDETPEGLAALIASGRRPF